MGKHAIIIIKNEQGKYLQYFDQKWNCYLFLNCKLPNGEDINLVKAEVSSKLNIKKENIKVTLLGIKKHKKFSESAKIEKNYKHFFYKLELKKPFNNDDFEINGIHYKWFDDNDFINDVRIQKVNSDIVQFVKEFDKVCK